MTNKRALDQQLLQELLNVSIDGFIVTDEAGKITMANRAVQELFLYSEEQLLSQSPSLLFDKENGLLRDAFLQNKEALSGDRDGLLLEGLRKDQRRLPLVLFARTLTVGAEQYIVEVIRDITKQTQVEFDIRAHQKDLEEAVSLAETRIMQQQDDLLELSTPVLEVWPQVLVMPLIGTLDSRRTEDALIKSLECISTFRAATVIVDITGVPVVDTMVADHLMQMAAAIRLMGVNCVLTGIRPVIAKTIVQLGVDLTRIVTRRTLADGLSYAVDQLNEGVS